MKTNSLKFPRHPLRAIGALALVLLCSGCLEKRFLWSPDGTRAAVIGKDGLRICDADGNLSGVFIPDVTIAAWLGDSKQLVVGRTREVKDWTTLEKVLGPDAAIVRKSAEAMWEELQSGSNLAGIESWSSEESRKKRSPGIIYLRDRQGAELRKKLSEAEWKETESRSATVSELVVARIEGNTVTFGAPLHEGLGRFWDIRPRPQGGVVAFTLEMQPKSDALQLLLVPLDGASRPVTVIERTAFSPDWTADGKSIVYFESTISAESDDQVGLGALVARQAIDDGGSIALADKPRYLAGTMFSGARVRCLRDGRILFNSGEITLPMAAEDYGDQREQLFSVDPARQPTVVRLIPRKQEKKLPKELSLFEVSPDEKQVLFGGNKGAVCLLTLATGEVEEIQRAGSDDLNVWPVWRPSGEITYAKIREAGDGGKRTAEIVMRRGNATTVLSRTWSDEILADVLK